ncbi:MAG: UbiA prenyltransferase family protein [Spirochaetes bacterium]|nr:UbiA prenyltransferase family protein [Spirochaetota bacterium]
MMGRYLQLMRLPQYVKNLFIFMPLFFGLRIMNAGLFLKTLVVFVFFCLVSSAVYIFNDYFDREDDRNHPVKKGRPLASGAVSNKKALVFMCLLLAVGLTGGFLVNFNAFLIMLVYAALNLLYTVALKHLAIIDVIVISIGMVLRLFIGAEVSRIHLSMWIIIMTFLLALFLAFAKRREDVLLFVEKGEKARTVVGGYTIEFLNVSMIIMAAVVVISYIMYTISPVILKRPHGDKTYLTVLWVVVGILRYMQLSFVYNDTGSPTRVLLTDRFLQMVLAGWIISFWILMYL